MTVISSIRDEVRCLHGAGLDVAAIADRLGVPVGRVVCCWLPPQQIRVVELIVVGSTDRQVAAALGITLNTVRTHMSRVADALGLCGARRSWITAFVLIGAHALPSAAFR